MALPIILGAMAATAIGSSAYYLWDKWTRKTIVILGRQATGKTTLITYLQTAKIEKAPQVTAHFEDIQQTETKHLQNLGLEISLQETLRDYSGDGKWTKEIIDKTEILLYLFRVDEWYNDPSHIEKQIEEDLKNISAHLNKKEIPIFFIGSHFDKINIRFKNTQEKAYFIQDLQNEPFFKNMKARFTDDQKKQIYVHIGSLHTKVDLEDTIKVIAKHLGK